jgi:hypothetical protein
MTPQETERAFYDPAQTFLSEFNTGTPDLYPDTEAAR